MPDLPDAPPRFRRLAPLPLLLAALLPLGFAGCGGDNEPIHRYEVKKPHVLKELNPGQPLDEAADVADPTDGPDRMLAAIVPVDSSAWFFKVSGSYEAVSEQKEKFDALIASLTFDDRGQPVWKLPEGWTDAGQSKQRFTTLKTDSKPPLELSVTTLGIPPNVDFAVYSLMNVNRWRGQLSLKDIPPKLLAKKTTAVEIEGTTATVVDLRGIEKPDAMRRGPFQKGAGDGQ